MVTPRRELADWQIAPNEQQIKAVASATRLRILRLCNDREWTNKELAERLDLDPSTVHRHVRLLVDAGLLAPIAVRQGATGAYEKPYRSTGLSWKLSFEEVVEDEDAGGESAMLAAFRGELKEAGYDSIAEMTRFHLHLDDGSLVAFIDEFKEIVRRYAAAEQPDANAPGYGGMFIVHRLADDGPG
jgi:DNA-binding transcriptional ArsR family regulator